jgi:hypothetical protein
MSLLPYALRPRVILRAQIVKRGVVRGNPLLRPIAMVMVGQGAYVRRSAIRQGFVLGNPVWRAIGVGLVGQAVYRQVFHRPPERVAIERIRAGHQVTVATFEPTLRLSRRNRRDALARLEAEATSSVAARRNS